jgi:hypothetical protein
MKSRFIASVGAAVIFILATSSTVAQQPPTLPSRLSDFEFWSLSQKLSEPGGSFLSDNLVSNELGFQRVLGELTSRHQPGGVYLGVGPEQNFTYIAALKPSVVFIVDVRRENRDLHLMYKALFELAPTRADFVSMLFSRPRPTGLTKDSTVGEIFAAIEQVPRDMVFESETMARIGSHLTQYHRLGLAADELGSIKLIHSTFGMIGPAITYDARRGLAVPSRRVTYSSLMQAYDHDSLQSSYLASEARFVVVKDLHIRNLIVPVVGNFAGPSALRAVGRWLKDRNLVVSAFYLSNVEDYLRPDTVMTAFCDNATALPLDEMSNFIRSGGGRTVAAVGAPGTAEELTGTTRLPGAMTVSITLIGPDGMKRDLTTAEILQTRLGQTGFMTGSRLGSIRTETSACGVAR